MEKMVSLALIAYAIGLVLGETLRSYLFPDTSRKRKLYSGLFVLLKLKTRSPSRVPAWLSRLSVLLLSLSELTSELQ